MAKTTTIIIRGELNWSKVLGKARPYTGNPKYDKGPYWSVDITPDDESRKKLKAAGIVNKLREPNDKDTRKTSFLTLKVLQNKKDGTPNLDADGRQIVPKVSDVQGNKWDAGLIGNGSVADVKINVVDYEGTTGVYFQAMRVLKHVPFEGEDFAPISEDDAFFSEPAKPVANTASIDDFDDEDIVPF